MTRLVTPVDLSCFATCKRAVRSSTALTELAVGVAATKRWRVPVQWKACVACPNLYKAEVAETALRSRATN